jgi:hypothetical protein
VKNNPFKVAVIIFIFALAPFLTANSAVAASTNSLGIGVEVLPAQGAEDTTLGADGSLWFLIPPGKSGTRSFKVNSLANVAMRIQVSVGFGAYRNGESAFDDTKKSDIANWATFSTDDFTLNPGASKIVRVTFQVPKDAPIKANLATIFARGSMQNQSPSKAAFSVAGAARIAIPVFLGVGTAQQIAINFKIEKTTIKNVEGKRLAYIQIRNIGKTPVAPTGLIKVQSQVGGISIPQPIKVQSSTVIPGETREIIFLIPAYIPDGKWTFMEEFQQGPVFQTAEADIALTKPSIFTKANSIRGIIFILALVVFYFSLRILRRSRAGIKTSQEEDLIELELALEQIRKKNLRNKSVKKAPAKKAPAKKAPAKKAPAKKKATKKAATKKK